MRFDLGWNGRRWIIWLIDGHVSNALCTEAEIAHIAPQLFWIPRQELQKPPLSAEELGVGVLDRRRKVLTRQIVEDAQQYRHGLRNCRGIRLWWKTRCEQN